MSLATRFRRVASWPVLLKSNAFFNHVTAYLSGVAKGRADMGKDAPNLSPAVISRLTAEWQNQLPKVVQGIKFQNGIEVIKMSAHHAA